MTLVVRDDRVSPLVDVVQTALDIVRLGVRGGSSGGMSLMSLSLSDNIRRRLSGVSLSETVTSQRTQNSLLKKVNVHQRFFVHLTWYLNINPSQQLLQHYHCSDNVVMIMYVSGYTDILHCQLNINSQIINFNTTKNWSFCSNLITTITAEFKLFQVPLLTRRNTCMSDVALVDAQLLVVCVWFTAAGDP